MSSLSAMEEKLIVAVCSYPVLYDQSSVQYRDRNKKDLAWRSISEEVGISGKCRSFFTFSMFPLLPDFGEYKVEAPHFTFFNSFLQWQRAGKGGEVSGTPTQRRQKRRETETGVVQAQT